ncbi:MAG: HAD family hydrolase [Butyrivibrio sp.]|nr:HAD family hydrolase [Butyrivibrio sp.]
MNKAVILDRDGTINIDHGYVCRGEDFTYHDGVIEGLKILQQEGYILIVITNQSGIARGYFTEDDYKKLDKWMIGDLKRRGINISASYYCPHHPEAVVDKYRYVCNCRKPGIALFEKAVSEFDIDLNNLIVVGDKERDVAFCKKHQSVKGIVIYSNEEHVLNNISYVKGGLLEAAKLIIGDADGILDQADY